jgi:hypothetical protein
MDGRVLRLEDSGLTVVWCRDDGTFVLGLRLGYTVPHRGTWMPWRSGRLDQLLRDHGKMETADAVTAALQTARERRVKAGRVTSHLSARRKAVAHG